MVFPRFIYELDAVDVNAYMAVSVVDQGAVNQFGTGIFPGPTHLWRTALLFSIDAVRSLPHSMALGNMGITDES